MCIRHTGTPASATTSAMAGSCRSAVTSLTKPAPARIACAATSALTVSIEIGTSVACASRVDHRQHPLELDLERHRVGARPGRLPADVEQVGAVGGQLQAVGDRGVGVEERAAVRERVGGHVDHAHHGRGGESVAERLHAAQPSRRRSVVREGGGLGDVALPAGRERPRPVCPARTSRSTSCCRSPSRSGRRAGRASCPSSSRTRRRRSRTPPVMISQPWVFVSATAGRQCGYSHCQPSLDIIGGS